MVVTATVTVREMLRVLLKNKDTVDRPFFMKLLADALDDIGACQLAAAYRWAAENGRWPRLDRYGYPNPRIMYDWWEERTTVEIPDSCKLEWRLHGRICRLEDKKYGGVNRAFILLARAMAEEAP